MSDGTCAIALWLRDIEEMMSELAVDHATIGRWLVRYAPELHQCDLLE
jgi:transposase-like protein